MFGIEGFKLTIILIAALVLIGPDKLPEIARTIGKFIKMFQAAKEDMERTIKADMFAVEETSKLITDQGSTLASSLYEQKTTADDEEDEDEE